MSDSSSSSAPPHTQRVTIGPVKASELVQLRRLFEQAVRDHFSYFPSDVQQNVITSHSLLKLIKAKVDPKRVILVARIGKRLVGYCIAAVPKTGPSQLFWLYVEPDQRGKNTGLSLLSRTLKHMQAMGARDIFIATHDHRRYYERQGFKYTKSAHEHGIPMDIMVFPSRQP